MKFDVPVGLYLGKINPFTPKSDQYQIFPAVSPEILHHIVWRTWLFIAITELTNNYTTNSQYITISISQYISLLKGWENVLLELGSERVKQGIHNSRGFTIMRHICREMGYKIINPKNRNHMHFQCHQSILLTSCSMLWSADIPGQNYCAQ